MTTHAYFNDAYASQDFHFEADQNVDEQFDDTFVVGDRIGPPLARRRESTMLPAAIVIAIMVAAGFAAFTYRSALEQSWASASSFFVSANQKLAPGPVPSKSDPAPLAEAAAPKALIEEREIVKAPGADAGSPAPQAQLPDDTVSVASNAEPAAPSPARLPPPKPDPADPYQRKAAAVGLHPDLSRALLARLSAADYRNAGIAIKTAMAEASEGTVVVWPKNPEPKLAQFEVRFVQAAAAECRRYVVTVTKDRWQTTAPPIETCTTGRNAKTSTG